MTFSRALKRRGKLIFTGCEKHDVRIRAPLQRCRKRRNINAPLGADIRILGFLLNPSPRPLHMPTLGVRPADTHPKRKFVVQFGVSKVEIA